MGHRENVAVRVFIILSLVSLLSDMTYEGARSVLGPYTRILEGGLIVAGGLMLGELVGQLARTVSGGLVYRLSSPRSLWGLVFLGYAMNLGAVPLLAFAGHWWEAYALVVAERVGKGLRAPPRDMVLAEVSRGIGTHRAFAIHEVADQLGAVAGPAILALTADRAGVRMGFVVLAVPAAAAMALLALAWLLYPEPHSTARASTGRLPPGTIMTLLGLGLSLAALPVWSVLTYYMSPERAALLYSLAMLVDAAAAPVAGEAGERLGARSMITLPVLAGLAGLVYAMVLLGWPGWVAAVAWGAYMGFYEVLARSSVPQIVPEGPERGLAYGVLGLSSAVGLVASGLAYPLAVSALGAMGAVIVAVTGSLLSLVLVARRPTWVYKGSTQ